MFRPPPLLIGTKLKSKRNGLVKSLCPIRILWFCFYLFYTFDFVDALQLDTS
jgi:hypothetical protein